MTNTGRVPLTRLVPKIPMSRFGVTVMSDPSPLEEIEWEPHPRDECYFCEGGSDVLESHHIVPRRFGGSDRDHNLVQVCPTCHQKLERLYSERFYDAIGANSPADATAHMATYLLYLLDSVEFEIHRAISDVREELEEAKIVHGEIPDDLTDHISSTLNEYNSESDESPQIINSAGSLEQKQRLERVLERVDELDDEDNLGAPESEVIDSLVDEGVSKERLEKDINTLKHRGEIYEPTTGAWRVT